ncbi:neural cell adhesion molecule 1-like [Haliotis cracherodii]|uniref:neural cell adhesion molecule 1-like n=1 Tax=Haliotis cracherodii TaxID=6455 RepID=UPI0039E97A4F
MAWLLLALAFVCGIYQARGFEMELVPSYSPMFAFVNTKFTLTCKVKDLPEKATIEMESNFGDPKLKNFYVEEKTDVVGKSQVTSKTITKDSVEVSDSGSYWCQANSEEKSVNLVVIRVLTQNSNVTVGEDVTIKCEPGTTFEQLRTLWYKDGKMLDDIPGVKDRVTYGEKNFTLTLGKTVEDDAGEYTAKVIFFPESYQIQPFDVVVKMSGKPYFKNGDGNKEITISGNDSIDLSCNAFGYPKPDVTWLKDDEVIQPDSKRATIEEKANGSRLLITKVTKNDTGAYVCNIENPLGRKQRSFKVTVNAYDITTNCAVYLCSGLSQVLLLASVLCLTL